MGHFISAMVTTDRIDEGSASEIDLPVIHHEYAVIVPLNADHADHWTEKLKVDYGSFSGMMYDSPILLEFTRRLQVRKFALIETDYSGGVGTQWATVYQDSERVMPVTEGGINQALRHLGIQASPGLDEFDTLALGNHRDFDDYFEEYWDEREVTPFTEPVTPQPMPDDIGDSVTKPVSIWHSLMRILGLRNR